MLPGAVSLFLFADGERERPGGERALVECGHAVEDLELYRTERLERLVELDLDGAVGGVVGGLERGPLGARGRTHVAGAHASGQRRLRESLRKLHAHARRGCDVRLALGGGVEDDFERGWRSGRD